MRETESLFLIAVQNNTIGNNDVEAKGDYTTE